MRAVIVTWYEHRNFGFASVEGEETDAFVHAADCNGDGPLRVGDEIDATVIQTPKGPRLVQGRRIKAAS